MKPIGKLTLMLASMLLHSAPILAGESGAMEVSVPARAPGVDCHRLMTEKECDAHKSSLALLPLGDARDRFLAEHAANMREREAACGCTHLNAAPAGLYPRVIQVARHF